MRLTLRRRRQTVASLVFVGALAAAGAAGPLAGLVDAQAPMPSESPHADVLAQGVVQVGTGDHVWKLDFRSVTAPVEVPAAGPTFVVPSTAPVRLLGPGGSGLGAYVEPGEAVFVAAGDGYQVSAAAPADVLGVGLAGGSEPGSFPLVEGLYDLELIRDVLAPGERLPVNGAVAALVLVTAGAVTLPDGAVLPAGYNLGFTSDFALTNTGPAAAAVLVAALSGIDAPVVVGVPLPPPIPPGPGDSTPAGGGTGPPTVGNTTPGNTTPGNPTPGTTPGTTTPGDTTPGNTTPGGTTPGGGATVPTAAPPTAGPPTTASATTAAPTTAAPPPTAAPTTAAPPTTAGEAPLTLNLVSCSGGPSLNIRVDASAGDGFRRNVSSVTVSRQNNEGAYTSPSSMQWIGEDTAEHDEWSITNVVGQRQDMGDGLRIVARSNGGQTQTINTTLSAAC